ncbi:MAG: hypothetical protein HY927_04720 [Elusimicrobia bacterium]|nr:hypothetical protein [Elusimicrobiota bacterium]
MNILALWLVFGAAASAQGPAGLPGSPPAAGRSGTPEQESQSSDPAGRWMKQGASLVLYDSSGTIVHEIPLGAWEEPAPAQVRGTRTQGGTSTDGRFAWTFQKTTTWNPPKTKTLGTDRILRFYGLSPRELWSETGADAPESAEALALGASGEVVALALRRGGGDWAVAVRSYLGATLLEEKGFKGLPVVTLTSDGRYALARWTEEDKSATHTFIEVPTRTRHDIPSEEFVLGPARIAEDGKVFSGKRLLHDFARPAGKRADEE